MRYSLKFNVWKFRPPGIHLEYALSSTILPSQVMAAILGKRKRRLHIDGPVPLQPDDTVSAEQLQTLFRQHFEAKYKPLEPAPYVKHANPVATATQTPSESDDPAWEGLDDDKATRYVQVIEHTTHPSSKNADVTKQELKAFMVRPSFPFH